MNNAQLDMVLGYLNEGIEINQFDFMQESINELIDEVFYESAMIESLIEETNNSDDSKKKGFLSKLNDIIKKFISGAIRIIEGIIYAIKAIFTGIKIAGFKNLFSLVKASISANKINFKDEAEAISYIPEDKEFTFFEKPEEILNFVHDLDSLTFDFWKVSYTLDVDYDNDNFYSKISESNNKLIEIKSVLKSRNINANTHQITKSNISEKTLSDILNLNIPKLLFDGFEESGRFKKDIKELEKILKKSDNQDYAENIKMAINCYKQMISVYSEIYTKLVKISKTSCSIAIRMYIAAIAGYKQAHKEE